MRTHRFSFVLFVAACVPVFSPNLESVGTAGSTDTGSGSTVGSGTTAGATGTSTATTSASGTTGGACVGGAMAMCGDTCVNTDIDVQHCGACDAPCGSGEFCLAGSCTPYREVLSVSLGLLHTCAIVGGAGGTKALHCWGANGKGQLGLEMSGHKGGTPETIPSNLPPVPLPGEPLAVAAGGLHTCALVLPDGSSDRAVYCWGDNAMGQLTGSPGSSLGDEPGDVADGLVDFGTDTPSALACGLSHCCAITSSGASVRCWGDNTHGQVDPYDFPSTVSGVGTSIGFGTLTVATVNGIAVGAIHSCAHGTTDTSTAWLACWGNNSDGQLGTGNQSGMPKGDATILDIGDYDELRNLAAGNLHTCVQMRDSDVANAPWVTVCWGSNAYGQLGDGGMGLNSGPPGTSTPIAFGGADRPNWLSAGEHHTCASSSNPKVAWCWGRNENGQVGSGETIGYYDIPFELDLTSVQSVHTGGRHACIITNQQRLRCWGLNDKGQLGYGDTINRGATPETTPANLQDILL